MNEWIHFMNDKALDHISSLISRRFVSSKNNPKNLDPSYKVGLDFLGFV